LAAGLGLLVIIASGILLFLLFSGIGDESPTPSPAPSPTPQLVATPDFVERKEAPARRVAERQGLVLEVEYLETDEFEAGRVIEQLPDAGVEIPVGTSVQVTVATQAETVVVPDVHGIKEDKAIEQIEASGLRAGIRFTGSHQLPDGYVIETEPRAGASVTRGQLVDYVVSTGPGAVLTPEPIASPRPTATTEPTPTSMATSDPSPFPSQEVVLVGHFLCLELGSARSQLDEAGLLVGAIYPEEPPPEDAWVVHDQLPEPGESVPIGSAVDLFLMDPLEPCPAG
jgi:beta-lactam-binding protein with PASTA domain